MFRTRGTYWTMLYQETEACSDLFQTFPIECFARMVIGYNYFYKLYSFSLLYEINIKSFLKAAFILCKKYGEREGLGPWTQRTQNYRTSKNSKLHPWHSNRHVDELYFDDLYFQSLENCVEIEFCWKEVFLKTGETEHFFFFKALC